MFRRYIVLMIADINGTVVLENEAGLPLNDRGLLYGAIVVDRVRTFQRTFFRWPEHLARFKRSCELAHVPLLTSDDDIRRRADNLLSQMPADAVIILIATPGPIGGPPTLILQAEPVGEQRNREIWDRGVRLSLSTLGITTGVDPAIKHRSRLSWWIAKSQLADNVDPLFVDMNGLITETPIANVVAVFGSTLITPPRSTVLPGISLQICEEVAKANGLTFDEKPMTVEDVNQADELLLTCTTWSLTWVAELDQKRWTKRGKVAERLAARWHDSI